MYQPIDDSLSLAVIIPVLNGDRHLKHCLDSVLAQTRKPDEIIISDDGSSDQTLSIAFMYSKKFSNIKVVQNNTFQGLACNKNFAVRQSTSSHICFLDSDDIFIENKKLEEELKIVSYYSRFNINVAAFSYVVNINHNGEILNFRDISSVKEGEILINLMGRRNIYMPRDFIFSKEIFTELGGFDETARLYIDWEFKLRLASRINFICTRKLGTGYRIHQGLQMSKAPIFYHYYWIFYGFKKNIKQLSVKNKVRASFNLILYFLSSLKGQIFG